MANWASSCYAIEGPKEILDKIYKALEDHPVQEGSSENWEGNVLAALGLTWEDRSCEEKDGKVLIKGKYMRGFIFEFYWNDNEETVIRITAEEAWGLTDFNEVLEEAFPDIKVYWVVEECGEELYATNDREGKYFPDRYYVDTCINGSYQCEYFTNESKMYKWLSEHTDGRVTDCTSAEKFNSDYKDSGGYDENYIHIYEFDIVSK